MSDIYLSLTETPSVVTLSQPVVSGALSSTVTVANTVTVALDANSLAALENITVTVGPAISGTVTVSSLPALAAGTAQIGSVTASISGTVPVSISSVTIGNFPTSQTIAGTVTANVTNSVTIGSIIGPTGGNCLRSISPTGDAVRVVLAVKDASNQVSEIQSSQSGTFNIPIYGSVTVGNSVTIGSLPAISGTVTVSSLPASTVTISNFPATQVVSVSNLPASQTVAGTVTIGNATTASAVFTKICGERQGAGTNEARELVSDDNGKLIVTIQPSNSQNDVSEYDGTNAYIKTKMVAGSVTVGAMPSGALTTRFGSVTTASVAQLTGAVTNSSRKFLLVQNIATSTVTIGIGFAPTTTQGIQLTAGGGLTFDAFCPTGGVWWLSSTTGSNFSILEG